MTDSPAAPLTDKPLADITVLDLTVALAGPFATLLLAGLGARVIKIEGCPRLESAALEDRSMIAPAVSRACVAAIGCMTTPVAARIAQIFATTYDTPADHGRGRWVAR